MSKVTITMIIDVPNIDNYSDAELRQNVFDDVINYAEITHLQDAVKWMASSKGDKSSMQYLISKHHSLWADIIKDCVWSLEREK